MTDILNLIENLAPFILLIAVPIAAARALDAPDLHVRDWGNAPPVVGEEDPPPAWRFDRLATPARRMPDLPAVPPATTRRAALPWP
jgi:hypothetical protein